VPPSFGRFWYACGTTIPRLAGDSPIGGDVAGAQRPVASPVCRRGGHAPYLPHDVPGRLRACPEGRRGGGLIMMTRFSRPQGCAGAPPCPGRSFSGLTALARPPPGQRLRSGALIGQGRTGTETRSAQSECPRFQGNPARPARRRLAPVHGPPGARPQRAVPQRTTPIRERKRTPCPNQRHHSTAPSVPCHPHQPTASPGHRQPSARHESAITLRSPGTAQSTADGGHTPGTRLPNCLASSRR
jgi:hypothetical protein